MNSMQVKALLWSHLIRQSAVEHYIFKYLVWTQGDNTLYISMSAHLSFDSLTQLMQFYVLLGLKFPLSQESICTITYFSCQGICKMYNQHTE